MGKKNAERAKIKQREQKSDYNFFDKTDLKAKPLYIHRNKGNKHLFCLKNIKCIKISSFSNVRSTDLKNEQYAVFSQVFNG